MADPQQVVWDEPKIEWDGDHADALARVSKPTKFEQENSSVGRNFARGVGESIHHIGENLEHMNPLEAGMSMVGAGGQTDIQPPAPGKEFKWSDARPSVRNIGRSLVDDIAPGKDLSERGANAATLPLTGLMAGRNIPIQGRFPRYSPPEQVPFNLSRATTRAAAGAGLDLLSPTPSGSKAATGAAVGLATEVLPWAVTKAARSKPVVDFLTRKGGPRTPATRGEPLWKQAGIQEGHGEPGSNVQVTNVPEPTPRPRTPPPLESEVQAARDNIGPIHEIEDVPENLRPKPAPPTGDPVSRAAGETKNLAADMEQASELPRGKTPENPAASNRLEADMSEDETGPEIPGALTTKRQAAPYDTSKSEIPGVKSPDSVAHKALSDLGFEPRNFDIENVRATTGGDVDEHEATADYIWDHMMGEPSWLDPDDMAEHLRSGKQLDDQGILDLAKKKITSSPKPTADEVKKFTQERDTDIPRGLSSDEYDRIDEEDERIGPYVDAVEQFGQKTVDSWFARPSKGPKALPISDTAKDAFQRFVKSKGKEGPLARQAKKYEPPTPKAEPLYHGTHAKNLESIQQHGLDINKSYSWENAEGEDANETDADARRIIHMGHDPYTAREFTPGGRGLQRHPGPGVVLRIDPTGLPIIEDRGEFARSESSIPPDRISVHQRFPNIFADNLDDQAVRQEIESRTQVRPKEPGRKGKAELAEEFKRGKKK